MENLNRDVFDFNMWLDRTIMKPVAKGYRNAFPEWSRDAVRNGINNLNSPVTFANDLLQAEMKRACVTLFRFVVNTAFGPVGLRDVAKTRLHMDGHTEDFGQTLAVWGAGDGIYIMLPFLGPSNPRDLTGRIVDFGLNPRAYVDWGNLYWVPLTITGTDLVDSRSRTLDQLDDLQRTSVDFYAAIKSLYEQNRESEIHNGKIDVNALPDF